jgi:hypothetical protein
MPTLPIPTSWILTAIAAQYAIIAAAAAHRHLRRRQRRRRIINQISRYGA